MAPAVSVVIPVYNGEGYIENALKSVFDQTFKDYEIVVVDDGSTDRTPQILRGYSNKIRVVRVNHVGLARALNTGLDSISGEYFCYLACDDLWHPQKLEVELRHLKESGMGVAYDDYYILFSNSRTVRRNLVPSDVERGGVFNLSASMIKTWCLREIKRIYRCYFDETLLSSMDLDLSIKLSKICRFVHVPDALAYYRIHPGQMSKSRIQAMSDWIVFKKHHEKLSLGNYLHKYIYDHTFWFIRAIFDNLLHGHPIMVYLYQLFNFYERLRSRRVASKERI